MRIIAGTHRGRVLKTPEDQSIRPTLDKTRGAIFNILEHRNWPAHPLLPTSRVVDVFCGTGALGLEALSRGVEHVTFVDEARAALSITRANIATLKAEAQCTLLQGDATRMAWPSATYDLVLLDPPYRKGLVEKALLHMEKSACLKPDCVIMAETARDETITLPAPFAKADERIYGDTKVHFLVMSS